MLTGLSRLLLLLTLLGLLLLCSTSIRQSQEAIKQIQIMVTIFMPFVGKVPSPERKPISSKQGVGLTYGCAEGLGGWAYDWSAFPPDCQGMEMVPMLWSGVTRSVGGSSDWLMGFNEPDRPEQANLSPEQAARLWQEVEVNFPSKHLVAPVPSQLDPGWLPNFREAFKDLTGRDPRMDALAVHCYFWSAAECETLIRQFEEWAAAWKVPEIWVSEFAFSTAGGLRTQESACKEATRLIDWMNKESWVRRFAWFASKIFGTEPWAAPPGWNAPLLDRLNNLTFWGRCYLNYYGGIR